MAGKLSHDTMNCIVTEGWLGWLGVSRYSQVYHDKEAEEQGLAARGEGHNTDNCIMTGEGLA